MKCLSEQQVEQFQRDGYVAPIRVMSTAQAAALRGRLEAFERTQGGPLKGSLRHKTHLLFTWLNDLVRSEGIVDAIEDLYGPDLLCWTTNFFIKEARDPAFVSWHQDSTYWGLSRPDVVTAWVALSDSNVASGAMEVIPGSHLLDQIPHRDTYSNHNLLTRGQEVAVEVDSAKAQAIVLQPGEMSLHHVRLVHGSEPNRADHPRTGYAIRYIPTHVRQIVGDRDSATLVRGVDRYGHFEAEPRPRVDFDPEALAFHSRMVERTTGILYSGASQRRDLGDGRSLAGRA